jgi:hypothetical protein
MHAHKMSVIIPENHQLVVDVPRSLRSGPAELIFLVPANEERTATEGPKGQGRLSKLVAELSQDPRAFSELSQEEKRTRLRRIQGSGAGLLTPSEEFARRKAEEIEIEDRKLGR